MSAPGNRRHRNHALALRHLFISTGWKLQLVSSRAAKPQQLTSSNPSLHHPGDPYSGIRSSWGLSKSEEKMDSWSIGPGLWIRSLLWKATASLKCVVRVLGWNNKDFNTLQDLTPIRACFGHSLLPLVFQDEWKLHLPSLHPALLPNQPLRSAPVGKLLSCLSCLSNQFTKF